MRLIPQATTSVYYSEVVLLLFLSCDNVKNCLMSCDI